MTNILTAAKSENLKNSKPERSNSSDNKSGAATAANLATSSSLTRGATGPRSRKASGPRTIEGKQRSKRNSLKHGVFSASILVNGESQAAYDSLLGGLAEALAPIGKLEEVLVEKFATTLWRHHRLIQAEGAEIRNGVDLLVWEHQIRKSDAPGGIDFSSLFGNLNEPGLFLKSDNLFALKRCLDLLTQLRKQIAENGFTESDIEILNQLYGNADKSNLGDTLRNKYLDWSDTASGSEAKRLKEGHPTREECKLNILVAIDREIRRLREHQKFEALRRSVPDSPALDRLLRYETTLDRSFDRTLSQLERLQRMRLGQPVLPKLEVSHSIS